MRPTAFLACLALAACAPGEKASEPDGASPAPAAPAPAKPAFRAVDAGGLKFDAPEAWVQEEPANRLRKAQFRIPDKEKKDKDGVLAVFYFRVFSPVENNIRRWGDQMGVGQPPIEKIEGKAEEVMLVDLTGSYIGDSQIDPIDEARMMSAIVHASGEQWFLKLVGPAGSVGDWREEFVRLLKSAHR